MQEVSDGRRFQLIEALAGAVADAIVERFLVEHVRVRVRAGSEALRPPGRGTRPSTLLRGVLIAAVETVSL